MKVTRKDMGTPTTFEMLTAGAVFDYEGEAYMKTYSVFERQFQAVELREGGVYRFDEDIEVVLLDAELIVRGELHED